MDFEAELAATSREEFVDDALTKAIIGCAIRVHRALGPGLLESAYQVCLCHELGKAGLRVEREVVLPVEYDGVRLECGYRIDLVVEGQVIVEVKCVERLLSIHEAQLLTYMRLAGISRGLLLNFNVALLKDGILRRVLSRPRVAAPAALTTPRSACGSSSASSAPLR